MLAWITLNLPTHVSATIPAIGKVMMAITEKVTVVLVVKLNFCICAKMAMNASAWHTIITIAPFSVTSGNLYLTLHEQYL